MDDVEGMPRGTAGPVGWTGRQVLAVALTCALLGGVAGAAAALAVGGGRAAAPPAASARAVLAEEGAGTADRVAAVARAVLPSVVRIDVRGIGTSGNASGVAVDDRGHIVTNHHVIAGATDISVVLPDRSSRDAVLVGSDPRSDLAVLQLEGDDLPPPVAFAPSGEVEVGQLAVVVGSPHGLDGSVSAGIVSALDRPVDLRGPDGEAVRLPGVLQTDAAVSPGSSGGPVVDARGRLLGVTSAVLAEPYGGDVGFALPVAVVRQVVEELLARGRVAQPVLGLAGTALEAGAAAALDLAAGVAVDRVEPGGPADQAGIRAGDVLVAVDGRPLAGVDDLLAAVRQAGVGGTLALEVVRDGTTRTASATLADADDRED